MAVHSGEDIGIAEVTRQLARRLDAPAVLSHFSRLVVDPNRGLDNPTLMPEVSDGTVVPGNRALGAAERRVRAAPLSNRRNIGVGKMVVVRVSSWGRRILKKKK